MLSTVLALSAAMLVPQQAPISHDQAVTCTGVMVYVLATTAQTAETNPTAENQETAAAAGRLVKAADADRLEAARREGLTTQASGEALQAWLNDNLANPEVVISRELDGCLGRYMDAI